MCYVEIELHSDKTWLLNQMEAVDIEQDCDFDEGDGCELDEIRRRMREMSMSWVRDMNMCGRCTEVG